MRAFTEPLSWCLQPGRDARAPRAIGSDHARARAGREQSDDGGDQVDCKSYSGAAPPLTIADAAACVRRLTLPMRRAIRPSSQRPRQAVAGNDGSRTNHRRPPCGSSPMTVASTARHTRTTYPGAGPSRAGRPPIIASSAPSLRRCQDRLADGAVQTSTPLARARGRQDRLADAAVLTSTGRRGTDAGWPRGRRRSGRDGRSGAWPTVTSCAWSASDRSGQGQAAQVSGGPGCRRRTVKRWPTRRGRPRPPAGARSTDGCRATPRCRPPRGARVP